MAKTTDASDEMALLAARMRELSGTSTVRRRPAPTTVTPGSTPVLPVPTRASELSRRYAELTEENAQLFGKLVEADQRAARLQVEAAKVPELARSAHEAINDAREARREKTQLSNRIVDLENELRKVKDRNRELEFTMLNAGTPAARADRLANAFEAELTADQRAVSVPSGPVSRARATPRIDHIRQMEDRDVADFLNPEPAPLEVVPSWMNIGNDRVVFQFGDDRENPEFVITVPTLSDRSIITVPKSFYDLTMGISGTTVNYMAPEHIAGCDRLRLPACVSIHRGPNVIEVRQQFWTRDDNRATGYLGTDRTSNLQRPINANVWCRVMRRDPPLQERRMRY